MGRQRAKAICSTNESHQGSASQPSVTTESAATTVSNVTKSGSEEVFANTETFTWRDLQDSWRLQDYLYTLVTNDSLGIKRSREQWQYLVPRPSSGKFGESEPREIPWPDIRDDYRSFTLFPNLPTELRLQIWKAALPGPRLVWMHPNKSSPILNSRSFSLEGHAQVSYTFHEYVCQESWTVLSENYSRLEIEESITMTAVTGLASLSFIRGIPDRMACIRSGKGVQAYIDCSRDTLVVSALCLHKLERIIDLGVLSDFSSVRNLALRPETDIPYRRRGRSPLEMSSVLCSSLDNLTVILGVNRPPGYVRRWRRYCPSLTEIGDGTQNPSSGGRDLNRRFVGLATHLRQQYKVQRISAAGGLPKELKVSVVTWEHFLSSQYWYYERVSVPTFTRSLKISSCSFIERPIKPRVESFHYHITLDGNVCWKQNGVAGGYNTALKDICHSNTFDDDKYWEEVNVRDDPPKHGGKIILKPRGKMSSWKWEINDEEISNRLRYPYLNK